jgi:hypothetical protein
VSGHIKNRVKSIIFFGSGKKRGSVFEAHKNKVWLLKPPNGTPPSFLLYYDIGLHIFISHIP